MRIAVISDIHGNDIAFQAVLNDLAGEAIDQIVCLGDAIQGGPQPAQVVQRLRALGCPVVMGNADDFLLTGAETGAEQPSAERKRQLDAVREWSISQLTAAEQSFIAAFQPTIEVPLGDERSLLGFHGSPHSYDDIIVPETPAAEAQRMLGGFDPHILAGGHTHIQQLRHLGRSFYFGCGSIGLAFRHGQPAGEFRADPWAEYAILSVADGRTRLEFRRVPFDVAALIAVYRGSGRPYTDQAVAQYLGA